MRLPVTLKLKSSPMLATALVLAHGLAIAGVLAAELPIIVALLLAGLALSSLWLTLKRHVLQLPIFALILKADGSLELQYPDGASRVADILSGTSVFPWAIVLLLRVDGCSKALTLLPDALDGEGHRRLRLWLQWKASAATA